MPEVLWFEEDPSILGARFVVHGARSREGARGQPQLPRRGLDAGAASEAQRRVWESGLDTMARIHRLDRDAVGLGWIAASRPRSSSTSTTQYRTFACGDVPYPAVDRAFEILEAMRSAAADRPALCWGDSRIGNMIFGADQRVAAVLDWEMVTAGDPVQDLAWYLLLDRHHSEALDVPRLPGLPPREDPSRGGRPPAALRRSTSSGTSSSAPPASRRSWCA